MKYKSIKVDMDYCAEPLWVSEDGGNSPCFANGSLQEFDTVLSKGLLHGLLIYRRCWEISNWSRYMSPTQDNCDYPGDTLTTDYLYEMQRTLAAKLKEELPDVRVYVCVENECWRLVEIGGNND